MKELWKQIIYCLDHAQEQADNSQVFAGFDGYIDVLAKPVQRSSQQGDLLFFETISEFGAYLQTKAAKSCSGGPMRIRSFVTLIKSYPI